MDRAYQVSYLVPSAGGGLKLTIVYGMTQAALVKLLASPDVKLVEVLTLD